MMRADGMRAAGAGLRASEARAADHGSRLRHGLAVGHRSRAGVLLVASMFAIGLPMLTGCAASGPPVAGGRLLPEFDPDTITTPVRANLALRTSESARAHLEHDWHRREYDCYQRWLVNRCRTQLAGERRVDEARLTEIEVQARQVLREDEALAQNRAQAELLADRQAQAQEAERNRLEAAQASRRRQQDAEDNVARREADEARRARDSGARARQAAERDRQARERREAAEAKRRAAPGNVQKFQERQHDQQRRTQDHRQREAERGAKATAEQSRRIGDPDSTAPR